MKKTQLIIGMPAGSLADPTRGGSLADLLEKAGFPSKGYDTGGPTSFPLTSFLVGWDGRPQEFSAQLALGEIDVAIGGQDWMRERQLEFKYEHGEEIDVTRVMSLERGSVRIVIINADKKERDCDVWLEGLLKKKPLITMVSEMPYLALEWFQNKLEALGFSGSHKDWSVQKFKTPPKVDRGLVIYETWGKTEAKVLNGSVDFGMEITQSGNAIRNYGLHIADLVMTSDACVWANKSIKNDPEKYELAKMFLLNLYGAVFAEHKVMILFNAPKNDVEGVVEYLRKNRLFSDEPTMSEGTNYVEISIQLDATSKDLPLAQVRYELAKLGATAIETIPLESSIPAIDAIDF